MPHPRTLRALSATIPLLVECRDILAISHAPRHNKLVARIDYRLARLKRMGVVK